MLSGPKLETKRTRQKPGKIAPNPCTFTTVIITIRLEMEAKRQSSATQQHANQIRTTASQPTKYTQKQNTTNVTRQMETATQEHG
jgi:RNase H-fold protein (predicted Holliday junction resolvase)